MIPEDLNEVGESFPGATVNGNVCVAVPSDQVEGGAWIVEALLAVDAERTFVALE